MPVRRWKDNLRWNVHYNSDVARHFDIIFALQRYSIALQTVCLWPSWRFCSGAPKEPSHDFSVEKAEVFTFIFSVEKQPNVTFKEHERSIMKNLIEDLIFVVIMGQKLRQINIPFVIFLTL